MSPEFYPNALEPCLHQNSGTQYTRLLWGAVRDAPCGLHDSLIDGYLGDAELASHATSLAARARSGEARPHTRSASIELFGQVGRWLSLA